MDFFCETCGYENCETGSRNCNGSCYQSDLGTKYCRHGVEVDCAKSSFTQDECVSRDSGFDFETDEQMNMELNGDVTMFEPQPQSFIKGHGHMPCEYNGGSLMKWRLNKQRKNDDRNRDLMRHSLHWEEFFGSSIDLTPTLLGIYDKIASAGETGEQGPSDQSEFEYFVTNENLEDGSDDQCHSPKSSPQLPKRSIDQSKFREIINQPISVKVESDSTAEDKYNNNRLKMDNSENKDPADMDQDNKKRPLSISSMSSSSTSSLSRRRKRPNLSQYSESTSSSQLDIEKLDNLLYIDDSPEVDVPERSADELSVCSEDKGKSGGDSDSQASADQPVNDGDQSESMDRTLLHQSDSSLSFTPSNSANCSSVDLSLNSDLKAVENSPERDIIRRSPSRISQKSTGMSRTASLKQQAHYVSFVQRVVTELVETERTYVLHLKDIKQGYYQYIKDFMPNKIAETDRECLFGNITQIYNFSCHFLAELEDCGLDPIKVAECFVKNSQGFVIYAEYCTNYPSAVAVLTNVMCDPQLNDVFKQRQIKLGHSLPLGAYLLKPVQRVLKYHLLLQNVLKHYSKTDAGHDKLTAALNHMTNMSHHINEMKRKHEHAVRVQEIQSQLEDYDGEDFTRLGELVLEGSFRMFGVKASRQMFLFEKGVIIAKRKEDGMLSCKAFIPCATLMLVESIPKEPLNFQILPFDNPRGAHIIHARNLDQKRKWCQEMKRLILESFTSKIPDNVKDLVIEKLGKSKEDDLVQPGSMDSGKSHVSTPDYLEKRLRARRKSGPALLTEILRPQRNRKVQQGKTRSESPNPKPPALESMMYAKNKDADQYGYRNLSGLVRGSNRQQENQENQSPNRAFKRPVSVQRSQSFQNSSGNSYTVETYLKEKSNMDSLSMDNLSQSDGPAIRTNSFRMATRISPIRFDSLDGAMVLQDESEDKVQLRNENEKHSDRIRPSVRKSIDDIDGIQKQTEQYFSEKPMSGGARNLSGSYLEELSSPKRSRYASMPLLNIESPSSPRLTRLASERTAYSPNMNHLSKSSIQYAKKIDIKPYFSYSRDRINQMSSVGGNLRENTDVSSLSKDQKHVNAFHDTFSNLKKSQENICDSNGKSKPLSLTQPKPFTSTLKNSASLLQSQARLNKWGPERFTKGSMSDLSHLREDPWVPNKQRSYTESKVNFDAKKHLSPKQERAPSKLANKQVGRLSLDADDIRHARTQSFSGDNSSASKDNLDWIVYANRNSIPVSGMSGMDVSKKYKYCTPPRGSMEPPPHSKDVVGDLAKTPLHQNVVTSHSTPLNSSTSHYGHYGSNKEADISNGDSTMSLSVTNTSSETCSSPDILKDVVFDDSSSVEKFFPRDRAKVSRSFSSPEPKRSHKGKRQLQEDRPASADVLGDVNHIEESEKLVAEMEHYLKRSSSSSGSVSSSNSKFPTCIPNFEKKVENRNHNRDSCLSTGSTSSYDSTGELSSDPTQEEGLVDSIKTKISSITSKFTGKKLTMSESQMSNLNENSPVHTHRYKQEDHPSKISHNFSLRLKPGNQKAAVTDLPSLLREMEPGSEAIGSRMANTDLDDYATFSLPRTQEDEVDKSTKEPRRLHYGRFSNANLTGSKLSPISTTSSKAQSQSESKLYHPGTSLKNLHVAQSDSAFSIQSVDIDSSSNEDSPRNGDSQYKTENSKVPVESVGPDNFYERRLSAVFNSDEAFRDSAVYCDDIDSPPSLSHTESLLSPKINIKTYVHHLEEKTKEKPPIPVKVRHKEPGAIIKQRMESLVASSEYRNKSASTSRSISTATSRTHSRCSSRASSEEKQLTGSALRDYIDSKFPSVSSERDTTDDGVFSSRTNLVSCGKLKPAFSTGRLDLLNMDVDNLVIMKGWVKELVKKFQSEK